MFDNNKTIDIIIKVFCEQSEQFAKCCLRDSTKIHKIARSFTSNDAITVTLMYESHFNEKTRIIGFNDRQAPYA